MKNMKQQKQATFIPARSGGTHGIIEGSQRLVWIVGIVLICAGRGRLARAAEDRFEVASIKLNNSTAPVFRRQMGPQIFSTQRATLKSLISLAYDLRVDQVLKGPAWIDSETYDVYAKAESPVSPERIRAMLATLLRDRFKLRTHDSTEVMAVYSLVLSSKGPTLKASQKGTQPSSLAPIQIDTDRVVARGCTMALFAGFLTRQLGRPVLDNTGLNDSYDFQVHYEESDSAEESASSLLSSLHDIGFRLISAKSPVPVLVVDGAEHPSPN
jgi:uncharacterized protein (TIGR03435 family)